MKRISLGVLLICLLLGFQNILANDTCGTNVKYVIDGNTIFFSKANSDIDAIWGTDCGTAFKNRSDITIVKVTETITVENANAMFAYCPYVQEMYLSNFDMSNVTDMSRMFEMEILEISDPETPYTLSKFNSALKKLDMSGWDTSNVTNMYRLFYGCSILTSLDMSGWKTNNVTSMKSAFQGCSSLTNLDLTAWNTSKVTNIDWMFGDCYSLKSLDISGWNTSNMITIGAMFAYCRTLTNLDLSSWNTSNVTNMSQMFYGCNILEYLNMDGWNTSKVTDMTEMFKYCGYLPSLDLSSWNTTNAANFNNMFLGCDSMQTISFGKNTIKKNIFTSLSKYNDTWYYIAKGADAGNPIELGSSRDNTSLFTAYNSDTMAGTWRAGAMPPANICGTNVRYLINGNTIFFSKANSDSDAIWGTDCGTAFKNRSDITIVKVTEKIKVENANAMFAYFPYVQEMYLSNFDMSSVTDMSWMFAMEYLGTSDPGAPYSFSKYVSALKKLDVSGWDTSNVTNMNRIFYGCTVLKSLNIRGWNTSNVTNMQSAFHGCTSLTNLDLTSWNTSKVTNMGWMFGDCYSLNSLNVSGWNTSNVTMSDAMFAYCRSLENLDLSSWNTANVTNMSQMFYGCNILEYLNMDGWNTFKVTDMTEMFKYCGCLPSLDLSSWNTTNVATFDNIFLGCDSIQTISLGKNTIIKNIFPSLLGYRDTWYYIAKGTDAGNPIELGSTRDNTSLFTAYDYNTMAGTWTVKTTEAVVIITGHQNTAEYDGNEHSVNGYDVYISNYLYTVNDFIFSGTAEAKRTNVGKTKMNLNADDFVNQNNGFEKVTVLIKEDGYQEITAAEGVVVTVSGYHDTAVYDGDEHSVSGYDVEINNSLYTNKDFSFNGIAKAARTEAGKTEMGLAADDFENKNDNFANVTFKVTDGYQEITAAEGVVVTVTGYHDTAVYDGDEHSVNGYDVEINNSLYTNEDFSFNGIAKAARTEAGKTEMGLAADDFENKNDNFANVTFKVTDGYQEIKPLAVKAAIIGAHNSSVYDGKEHTVSGFTVTADTALYKDEFVTYSANTVSPESVQYQNKAISGPSVYRTDVGTSFMGLKSGQFSNNNTNFKPVIFEVTDGYQEITAKEGVMVRITGHHDTAVYDGNEHSVSGYDVEISDPIYSEADFVFSGKAKAARTEVGKTEMGLKAADFENINDNFLNVFFQVMDGYQEITAQSQPEEHEYPAFFRQDFELPGTGITTGIFLRSEMPASVNYVPMYMELTIPSLDVTSDIVSVSLTEDAYPVQWLSEDAGFLEGTDRPGEGIAVLAGHNTLNAEEFGPFASIRLLEEGDRLFIKGNHELLIYEVYINEKIGSRDIAAVQKAACAYDNTLTLITCEDEIPEGGYAARRIVSARLIDR